MTPPAKTGDPNSPDGKELLTPPDRADWRQWLVSNHERKRGLWVVYRKRSSSHVAPLYEDLVEEALCFGWIDSQVRRVDEDRMMIWFSPRRRGGVWSAINKKRIERLQQEGLMTEVGRAVIDRAKADGSWSQTDKVDGLEVPRDLDEALEAVPKARVAYESLPPSAKKQILWSVYSAKRTEIRARRVAEAVESLSQRRLA